MEEDGFTLVVGNDGSLDVNEDTGEVSSRSKKTDDLDQYFVPRKKKKLEMYHDDFYKFQIRSKKLAAAMAGANKPTGPAKAGMPMAHLVELPGEKKRIQLGFEADKQRLQELRAKKNNVQ
jgi:hypothetical protein